MAELLEELLARCTAGDQGAVTDLVRRFREYAMDLATRILDDRHLAEDVVQEAFLSALDRLEDLRTPAAFPGWLRQIVRTHAVRAGRRRAVFRIGSMVEPDQLGGGHQPTPSHRMENEEMRDVVRAAVVGLPERLRETTALFYLNDLDHHSVAEVLDVPAGTVKRRLHDARGLLRDALARGLNLEPAPPDRCRPVEPHPEPETNRHGDQADP